MDTQQLINIKKRHFDVMTSYWRRLEVVCLLGWVTRLYLVVVLVTLNRYLLSGKLLALNDLQLPSQQNLFIESKITPVYRYFSYKE